MTLRFRGRRAGGSGDVICRLRSGDGALRWAVGRVRRGAGWGWRGSTPGVSEERPAYETHAQVVRVLEQARDADPRKAPFGVLIGDPWEGGAQQFFWYASREGLESALLDAHAFVDPDAFVEDQDEWREARFDLDAAIRELPELTPDDAEELDDLINDFFCIIWIGHFDDLTTGDDPVARTLREELHHLSGVEDDPSPLQTDELDEYIELLRGLGDVE
jgi:hypothetical protein